MNVVFPDFKEQLKKTTTQKNYEYATTEFFNEYPNYSDFSYDNCCQFFEDLQYKKNKTYATCVKKRRQLSSIFNYAVSNSDKYSELPNDFQNYFAEIPLNEDEQTIKFNSIISLNELDKLIQYTKENEPLCMLAIIFSFKMMMRISEFINLQWSAIEDAIDGNPLRVETATGPHYLKLPDDIATILDDYLMRLPSKPIYVFSKGMNINGTDKPFVTRAMTQKLTKACKKAEIEHYTFNDLRNAGITYAAANGCPIEILSKSVNMKGVSHINRLTSMKDLNITSASDYTNIIFTGSSDGTKSGKLNQAESVEEKKAVVLTSEEEESARFEEKIKELREKITEIKYGSWCVAAMKDIVARKPYDSIEIKLAFSNAHKKIRWAEDIFYYLDRDDLPGYSVTERFYNACLSQFKRINAHLLANEDKYCIERLFSTKTNQLLEKACNEVGLITMKKLLFHGGI